MSFRAGICGVGRIANDDHVPALKQVRGFDLTAVYDITPARRRYAEQAYQVKAYSDFSEFLRSGLDLIVISSPSNTHKDLAIQAIDKGMNVIVEKPLALNAADARKIARLAEKKGVLLGVYHNRRWDRDFLIIRKLLKEGLIGKPLVISSEATCFGSLTWYAVKEFNPWWRYRKEHGGGVLLDFGVHLADQLLQLVKDKPRSLWCDTKKGVWSHEVEDYFKCIIRFDSGLIAELQTSQITRYPLPRWHIMGTHGAILCEDGWNGPVKVTYSNSKRAAGKERVVKFGTAKKYIFYKNILKVLQKKERLLVRPDEVLRVMEIIDAARESARRKKEIRFGGRYRLVRPRT